MFKFTLVYPNGAGGNWLSNLVYSLEHNTTTGTFNTEGNFHSVEKSQSINLSHSHAAGPCVVLDGTAIFNRYLNAITKLFNYQEAELKNASLQDTFEKLASYTSYFISRIEHLDTVDINFNHMLNDNEKFAQELFAVLDQYNFNYVKDQNKINTALTIYRASCTDPMLHFDNFDSVYWLGWCNGICKYEFQDWPLVDTIKEMQDFLMPRRGFFKEFTKQYMVKIQ